MDSSSLNLVSAILRVDGTQSDIGSLGRDCPHVAFPYHAVCLAHNDGYNNIIICTRQKGYRLTEIVL
jgi:hypothetical protein